MMYIFLQAVGKAAASTILSMIREVVFFVGFAMLLPVFNAFIHAVMQYRADRIVREYCKREESPEQRLKDKDKRRAAYHCFYTNMK